MKMKLFRKLEEFSAVPLRMGLGALFLYTGIAKAIGMAQTIQMFATLGFPAAKFFAVLVMVVEIVGGAFLIAGLLTRYTSAVLAIVLTTALFVVHISQRDITMMMVIALIGALVSLVFSGAQRLSLDNWFLID